MALKTFVGQYRPNLEIIADYIRQGAAITIIPVETGYSGSNYQQQEQDNTNDPVFHMASKSIKVSKKLPALRHFYDILTL